MAIRSNIPQSRSALDQVHEQVLNRNNKFRQNRPDSFARAQAQYKKTHPVTIPKKPESLGITRGNPVYFGTQGANGDFVIPSERVGYKAGRSIVREAPRVPNYAAQHRRDVVGGVLGAVSGIASVAATTTAGASLAPVAVGLGLGYGAYKLGEAIGLY